MSDEILKHKATGMVLVPRREYEFHCCDGHWIRREAKDKCKICGKEVWGDPVEVWGWPESEAVTFFEEK